MTYGFGLGAGLKALTAARLGIQTAGHNVSNANTPGFSRQRVTLSSAMPFTVAGGLQMGTGVDISNIGRVVDSSLLSRLNLQAGLVARTQFEFNRMREVEGIFGEPDAGLSEDLASLFGSVGKLQTDPSDRSLRGGAVQSASTLADSMNLLHQRLSQMGAHAFNEAGALVAELNEKAQRIATLNGQVGSIEAMGSIANDVRDQRDMLAQEISKIANVRTIERESGVLDVLVGGHLLVSGTRTSPLAVRATSGKVPEITSGGSAVDIGSGKLGALLTNAGTDVSNLIGQLDRIARNLALEFNRVHTTGIPGTGPFQRLTSTLGVADTDGDGLRGDELLNQTGLPFDISAGQLWVNVTNRSTGDLERTRIDIDPNSMTLGDLASALSAIPNLSATVDPSGRLRMQAATGYGFDFAARLDQHPDTFGSFGGGHPVLGTSSNGPFDLSGATFPQQFTVDVDGTVETVTLNASDFASPSSATADELAAAINDDLTNATAKNVGGRLVIRSDAAGASAQLTLADGAGSPLAALGVPTGPASGQDDGVEADISGAYTGSGNGFVTFAPDADGEIGVTPGLTVGVFDSNGTRIGTLDVGAGYDGAKLDAGNGIEVSFSQGTVSASNNQAFALDTLADSDTSDLLAAIGMNSLFVGADAASLSVNQALQDNPDLFAGALSDASGDGVNLQRFMDLREHALGALGSSTLEDFYNDVITDLGFEVEAAETTARAEESLMATLEQERESISGVNVDEEMVDLVRHQQAFEAAARFISTVQELTNTLIQLGA